MANHDLQSGSKNFAGIASKHEPKTSGRNYGDKVVRKSRVRAGEVFRRRSLFRRLPANGLGNHNHLAEEIAQLAHLYLVIWESIRRRFQKFGTTEAVFARVEDKGCAIQGDGF